MQYPLNVCVDVWYIPFIFLNSGKARNSILGGQIIYEPTKLLTNKSVVNEVSRAYNGWGPEACLRAPGGVQRAEPLEGLWF